MNKDKWAKYQPLIWFVGVFLLGILVLFVAEYWLNGRAREITIGIGVSFITAAIIGGVIELAFVTRLAHNVFEVAFGYLLPEDIREEMKWLYGLEKIVVDYRHHYRFEQCNDEADKVWVYETINRTVHNIGNKDQEIMVGFGIEEWFQKNGHSQILSLKITHEDGSILVSKEGNIAVEKPETPKQRNYILHMKDDKIPRMLEPGKKFTWVATSKELRPKSADTVFFSATAAKNPRVTVQILGDMDYDLTFANRKQGELRDLGSGEWGLDALLLPGQAMRLRWWVKKDAEKWRVETYGENGTGKSN